MPARPVSTTIFVVLLWIVLFLYYYYFVSVILIITPLMKKKCINPKTQNHSMVAVTRINSTAYTRVTRYVEFMHFDYYDWIFWHSKPHPLTKNYMIKDFKKYKPLLNCFLCISRYYAHCVPLNLFIIIIMLSKKQ